MGLDKTYNLIIIGAGNLGQAIANYANFERRGFVAKAMFDTNLQLKGKTVRGIPVYSMDDLEDYIRNNDVQIAALTLPRQEQRQQQKDLLRSAFAVSGILPTLIFVYQMMWL